MREMGLQGLLSSDSIGELCVGCIIEHILNV